MNEVVNTKRTDANMSDPTTPEAISESKRVKSQQDKHQDKLAKKRMERWNQPQSHALIEDLASLNNLISDSLQIVHQTSVNTGFSLDVLVEVLIEKGLITKNELDKQAHKFEAQQQKFKQLMDNEKLSPEEKNIIAQEHGIEIDFVKMNA